MSKPYEANDPVKIKNEEDVKNFEHSVQLMRWLLQSFGMWPLKSKAYPRILRVLLVVFGYFLLIFLLIPYCLHMFIIVKDFKIRLRLVGPLSFCLMNLFKYTSVLLKNRQIRECITWMASDWQDVSSVSARNLMLESTRSARVFTKICVIFMYGSGMPYSTIFTFTQDPIIVNNVSIRQLAYPSYFVVFDPHVKPMYNVIFVIHCLCGFIMYTITCAVCSIAIVCCMHICGQIAVTSWMLRNLKGGFDEEVFAKIIVKHLRSLKFASKLERILNDMCLVEFLGCTFNICMLGYYFITEYGQSSVGPYMYILLWISLTFNIFIFCYIGDFLTEQCNSIGEVAYAVEWYNLSSKEARNLVLIVASTQHPVVLTAGKMTSLSLQSFSNVLKASLTYLNMLRTVTASSS